MKVLHICNTAGVGGYLAEFMAKYHNIKSLVLITGRYNDYKLSTEFVKNLNCNYKEFFVRCWLKGLFFDIIHIHGEDKTLKILKQTLPYKNKKIIIHYHGSDIRGRWKEKRDRWEYADKIIVSTPDLLEGSPEGAEYLPNVIDEKTCSIYKHKIKEGNAYFHVDHEASKIAVDYFRARDFFRNNGKRLIIHNAKIKPLNHFDFLDMLSSYEYYIDVKKREGKILEAISLTGLEALFMGVKVINWDEGLISAFPDQHRSINVVSKLKGIYEALMK